MMMLEGVLLEELHNMMKAVVTEAQGAGRQLIYYSDDAAGSGAALYDSRHCHFVIALPAGDQQPTVLLSDRWNVFEKKAAVKVAVRMLGEVAGCGAPVQHDGDVRVMQQVSFATLTAALWSYAGDVTLL